MSIIFVTGHYTNDQKLAIYLCYSISMLCLLLTIFVYLLNLKQLNLILEQRRFPLRKTRVWIISNLCFVFLIWQLLLTVYVSRQQKFKIESMTTFILMIFILYFSTSFYCWCFAWSLVTVSLARYHMNMSVTTFKTRVISIACYVIPALFTVTCTLIGYYTNDKELRLNTVYHTHSKWILVSFEIMVILGKLSLISYTFKKRIVILARLNFTAQEILKRVWQTNALRNGSIFQVLLLITIVLDVITVAKDEVFLPTLYAYVIAQTIMVCLSAYFELLELFLSR